MKLIKLFILTSLICFWTAAQARQLGAIEGYYNANSADVFIKKVISLNGEPEYFGMILINNGETGGVYRIELRDSELVWIPMVIQRVDMVLSQENSFRPFYVSRRYIEEGKEMIELLPQAFGVRMGCKFKITGTKKTDKSWPSMNLPSGAYKQKNRAELVVSENTGSWTVTSRGALFSTQEQDTRAGRAGLTSVSSSYEFLMEPSFGDFGLLKTVTFDEQSYSGRQINSQPVAVATMIKESYDEYLQLINLQPGHISCDGWPGMKLERK